MHSAQNIHISLRKGLALRNEKPCKSIELPVLSPLKANKESLISDEKKNLTK